MFPWLAKEEMSCLARCSLSKCDSCSNIAASFSQSFVHGIFLILDKAHSLNIQYFFSFIISLVAGIEYVPPSKHLLNVLGMLQGMD